MSTNAAPFSQSLLNVQAHPGAGQVLHPAFVRFSMSCSCRFKDLTCERTNEIGVRVALGADRANVLRLVLRAALTQLGLGLAIGIPAALAGGHLLAHQLYGVKSYDPTILGAAALVLAACAILAASIPARRATRVDPIVALRYE